jgi:hypothetical protein
MKHLINVDEPAKLIRADSVAQFGEGYRQISGPEIEQGHVSDLVRRAKAMPAAEQAKLFLVNVGGGVPLSIAEVEEQLASGTGGGWVVGNG